MHTIDDIFGAEVAEHSGAGRLQEKLRRLRSMTRLRRDSAPLAIYATSEVLSSAPSQAFKQRSQFVIGAQLMFLGLIPPAELCELFHGPKLVRHSNFANLRSNREDTAIDAHD